MDEKVVIRDAAADDIGVICRIENASFTDPWSEGSFREALAEEHMRFSVTEVIRDGAAVIAGYFIAWEFMDEGEILSIAVSPEFRRCGIGRMMMDDLLGHAKESGIERIYLEVRESNTAARAMYASFGFDAIGRRKRYYIKPVEDAVLMCLSVAAE